VKNFAGLLVCLFVSSAVAEPPPPAWNTVRQYERMRHEQIWLVMIGGAAEGILLAEQQLEIEKQKPLFCLPDGVPLDLSFFTNTLDTYIQRNHAFLYSERMLDQKITLVLLHAFIEGYPCNKKK